MYALKDLDINKRNEIIQMFFSIFELSEVDNRIIRFLAVMDSYRLKVVNN